MFRGDDRDFPVRVEFSNGDPVDMTGGEAKLMVKTSPEVADPGTFSKTISTSLTADGHVDAPLGAAEVPQMFFLIDPGDTSALSLASEGAEYHYAVMVKQASGDYTTVLWGKWTLEQERMATGWSAP